MYCSENQYATNMVLLRESYPGNREADQVEEVRSRIDSLWTVSANRPALVEARTRLAALPLLVEAVELQRARVRAQQAALTDQQDRLNFELSDLSTLLDGLQGGQGATQGR